MRLEDLEVYQLAMKLGDEVWNVIKNWDNFIKDTIGKQLIRAVDSVSANISEGFGRYSYNDSRGFLYYFRGSLYETRTWLQKAFNRGFLQKSEIEKFEKDVKNLGVKLNNYISATNRQSTK